MSLVEVAAGGQARLKVGDELVIRRSENASTGYVWSAASLPAVLEALDDGLLAPVGDRAGAAGEHVFRLKALEPGEGLLVLQLARVWEREPLEVERVPVIVEA